ncbi:MAG: putative von Willebrand factor type [Chloroflexi bacterium]|nr:putative von Willebrand factor type [Chloroflexota bacterium]
MPFSLSFGYPDALWLLLILPLVVFLARNGGSGAVLRKSARRLSVMLRLLIVTLIVLSIANLQLVTTSDRLATVFLLDVSDSVGADGRGHEIDFTRKSLQTMQESQQSGVVVFGQEALVEKLVSKDKTLGNLESTPTTSYSNLAEAVRLGTALLPGDSQRRLVLISDGNQNIDEVRNAAKIAAANGVQIDVVPLNQNTGPEVSIGNLQVPSNLRQGEEFSIKVAVDSNYAGPANLLILQDGQVISDKPVTLKEGSNLFSQQLIAKTKGFANYTAKIVTARDTLNQNNEANAYSLVKGGPRALLVEGHPDQHEAANLQAALTQSGIEATVISPDKFPGLNDLTQYDSVLLVNVPANTLTQANMSVLQAYVKDLGKGMVMVGGEESYGLGGYFRTPIEDMLPVELQLPSKLQTPSVAMVLVIDRSGSMADAYNGPGAGASGIPKIELAKDAAYLAATQLSNTDQVGVVVFDTQAQWQVPLGVMGNPSNLVSPIGRISPGGGTNVYSGLAPAIEGVKNSTAKNKHIILMTDGQDSEGIDYRGLYTQAQQYGITISTVGLGEDVNTALLAEIARQGGGRYTFVNDPTNLPKIFAKEAHLAARSYIVEENFTPSVADPSPVLQNITGTPELKGYVVTRAKGTATQALVTKRNEPLLATWQYGLGRVAAWTSDAKGRWATNWLGWQDFPKFWSQMVRWTVAENEAGGLQVQTKTVGNRIYVTADAISPSSQYLNGLEVKAKVVASSLNSQEDVTLTQTAPGHYEGYFTPKNTGSFIVNVQGKSTVNQENNSNINLTQTVGAVASYSPEYKQLGSNEALLKDIAALTGGRVLTSPAQAFRDDLRSTTHHQELWPWLMLLAILLFPLDIAARRIRLSPRDLWKGFRGNSPAQLATAGAGGAGGTSPGSPVNRLFEAKQRVNDRHNYSSANTEQGPPTAPRATAPTEYYQPSPGERAEAGWDFNPSKGAKKAHDKSLFTFGKGKVPQPGTTASKVDKPGIRKGQGQAIGGTSAENSYTGLVGKFNRANPQSTATGIPAEKPKGKPAAAKAPPQAPPPPPRVNLGETPDNVTDRLLKAKQRAREQK